MVAVERFENDEGGYLSWAEANPFGYVLNLGRTEHKSRYPVVHAVHHALWTSQREGSTRSDYIKVCSESLEKLEDWARDNYGRRLAHCRCMLHAQPSVGRKAAVAVPDMIGAEIAIQCDSASVDAHTETTERW
jgi:hypothetical protein